MTSLRPAHNRCRASNSSVATSSVLKQPDQLVLALDRHHGRPDAAIVEIEAQDTMPFNSDHFNATEGGTMAICEISKPFRLGYAVFSPVGLKNVEGHSFHSAAHHNEIRVSRQTLPAHCV